MCKETAWGKASGLENVQGSWPQAAQSWACWAVRRRHQAGCSEQDGRVVQGEAQEKSMEQTACEQCHYEGLPTKAKTKLS